ncbi:MAG: hypothetical protein JNL52_13340 [Flavobacteriales bacterium]|nr:hypothetical protein [Flavobacteriales bacterium]
MEPVAHKRSVLKAARTHLENSAAELRERITELKAVTIGDENAESASQTESTRGSDVELMNSLGEQLVHVQQELERMKAVEEAGPMNTVQYGAVVHTDQRNFLIATSIDEFDAGGFRYLGVTPKAPVIQALYGKKMGEQATINGVTYAIMSIF